MSEFSLGNFVLKIVRSFQFFFNWGPWESFFKPLLYFQKVPENYLHLQFKEHLLLKPSNFASCFIRKCCLFLESPWKKNPQHLLDEVLFKIYTIYCQKVLQKSFSSTSFIKKSKISWQKLLEKFLPVKKSIKNPRIFVKKILRKFCL